MSDPILERHFHTACNHFASTLKMWLANQNCTAIDANIYKPVTNICTQITKIRAIFSGQSYHYFTHRVRI